MNAFTSIRRKFAHRVLNAAIETVATRRVDDIDGYSKPSDAYASHLLANTSKGWDMDGCYRRADADAEASRMLLSNILPSEVRVGDCAVVIEQHRRCEHVSYRAAYEHYLFVYEVRDIMHVNEVRMSVRWAVMCADKGDGILIPKHTDASLRHRGTDIISEVSIKDGLPVFHALYGEGGEDKTFADFKYAAVIPGIYSRKEADRMATLGEHLPRITHYAEKWDERDEAVRTQDKGSGKYVGELVRFNGGWF